MYGQGDRLKEDGVLGVIMLYISRGLCGIIHDSLQDLMENGAQSGVLYEVIKRIQN